MATSGRRREADLSYAPNFFRTITEPRAHTLAIPLAFMNMFGHNLHNPVLLKVPNGSVSEVEVIQCNDYTLFQKGWQEFRERYSIGFGYHLVFEYDGNSQFDVNIFEPSGAEINYPSDAVFGGEDNGSSSRGKEIAVRVEDSDTGEQNMGEYRSGRRKYQRAVSRKTSMAYRKALAFTSAHTLRRPFYISLMHTTYVSSEFNLRLPLSFAKENLPSNSTTGLTICLKNGKAWPVSRHIGKRQVYIGDGWREFVVENGLKEGDACLFQVANSAVWNVDIFRG